MLGGMHHAVGLAMPNHRTIIAFTILLGSSLAWTACVPASAEAEYSKCNASPEAFVIRRAMLPRNFINADKWGFDFNADGKLDNALGNAAVSLAQFAQDFSPETHMHERLQDGAWRLVVYRCADRTRARIELRSSFGQQSVLATAIGDSLQSDPDTAEVALPLSWFADALGTTDDGGWLMSHRASLHLRRQDDMLTGRLAVALDPLEARAALLVPLADFFTYTPSAKLARQALDINRDGVVTANELASSGSFQQLTAADLPAGVPGVHQATVSLGIAIEATRVP